MRTIVLITESSNACAYGVGTYSAQLKLCLQSSPEFDLRVVHIVSGEDKEATVRFEENGTTIVIPKGSYYTADKDDTFQKGVARLLRRYIHDGAIFHFNFHHHLPLARLIKQYFPHSPRIYTIHYQNWTFRTKGLLAALEETLQRIEAPDRSLDEQLLCDSFFEERDMFASVDQIVCLSQYTADVVRQVFQVESSKLTVIHNGIEAVPNAPNGQRGMTDPMLLYVGRVHEDKGIIELVQAFKQVLHHYPTSKLFIVGDGVFTAAMKEAKGAWGQIIFTGKLERDEVYEMYHAATIGVLPSYSEQCSYTAIEMMMFGLPIVGVRTTGLTEMLADGENGLSIPLEREGDKGRVSVVALSEALITAIANRDKLTKGRLSYEKRYTLEQMGNGYRSLYNRLLS